jgi:hypothetical protein
MLAGNNAQSSDVMKQTEVAFRRWLQELQCACH